LSNFPVEVPRGIISVNRKQNKTVGLSVKKCGILKKVFNMKARGKVQEKSQGQVGNNFGKVTH
jgi:hypothetical protein